MCNNSARDFKFMEGINVFKSTLLGSSEKGNTYSLEIPRNGEFMLGYREAGSVNGKHYHKGYESGKNPEVLILLKGKGELFCRDLTNGKEANFSLEAPCRVEISPMIWHELKALTRIIFYELNTFEAHQKDTFYEVHES